MNEVKGKKQAVWNQITSITSPQRHGTRKEILYPGGSEKEFFPLSCDIGIGFKKLVLSSINIC